MKGKYFWLKLKKDFFKRHDIKILESMPDGHLSVLFYLKLMLESIDHNGELRFSDEVPYTPEMLAVITETDIGVVNASLKRLQDFKLLEITQNGTIVIDKVKTMIGFETDWAKKKREYRTKQGQKEDNVLDMSSQCPHNVLEKEDIVRQEIEKDIDIEKEIDIEIDKQISLLPQPALISKEEHIELLFKEFWSAYPRKDDKKRAWLKFKAIKNVEQIFPDIMADVENKKKSEQWNKNGGQFIPMPSTYLNNERWNDEATATRQSEIEDMCSDAIKGFL